MAAEVRAEMGRQQMTGKALAERLGVSHMHVSRRLNCEVPFDLVEIERVADVLAVPLAKILPLSATGRAA